MGVLKYLSIWVCCYLGMNLGDYSSLENYVQIYEGELKSSRADPDNSLASINQGRILNIKGENIEVEIKRDIHEGVIDGENIVVKNGEIVQRFDGAKTFVNRKGFEAFLVSDLVNGLAVGGGEIVTEVVGGEGVGGDGVGGDGEGDAGVGVGVVVESKPITSKDNKKKIKWVKMGHLSTYGGAMVLMGLEDPREASLGSGKTPWTTEKLISNAYIYADKDEIDDFLNSVKGKKLTRTQFDQQLTKSITNVKSIVSLQIDISKKQINANIDKTLKELKLPADLMRDVNKFKTSIITSLNKNGVPKGTTVIIINKNTGKIVEGYFTLDVKGRENPYTTKIPGAYIQKMIHKRYKDQPLTTELLWEQYNKD